EDRVAGPARLDGPGDVAGRVGVDADAAGDAADDAAPADHAGDSLLVDPVLQGDDEAARAEVLADQRRRPDRVVRLRADEGHLDRLLEEALRLVKVERGRVNEKLPLGALEVQPLPPDRLDVLRPGVDQGDVLTGPRQVTADVAADRAGAHERDSLAHAPSSFERPTQITGTGARQRPPARRSAACWPGRARARRPPRSGRTRPIRPPRHARPADRTRSLGPAARRSAGGRRP